MARLVLQVLETEAGIETLVWSGQGEALDALHADTVIFVGETSNFFEKNKRLIANIAAGGCKAICIGGKTPWMGNTSLCDHIPIYGAADTRGAERFRRELIIRVKSAYGRNEMAAHRAAARQPSSRLIGIGASTGGPQVLQTVLQRLADNTCGVLVVQHLSAGFSTRLADFLNALCPGRVKQAEDGEQVLDGTVYLAENEKHMTVMRRHSGYYIHSRPGEKVNGFCPSIDRLFDTLADAAGPNAMGVVLTGMGDDGARGLRRMRLAGADTVVQAEKTCTVCSMPHEAVRWDNAAIPLTPEQIADRILLFSNRRNNLEKE